MKELLQSLTNLQYIDNRLDELTQLRGDLPEEIEDIETDILRCESRLKRLREEERALSVEADALQNEIQQSKELVARYEEQQMSVRNNREYDALTKEIESQNQNIENALYRLDEIRNRERQLHPDLDHEQDRLEHINNIYEDKKEDLNRLVSSTKDDEDRLLKIREEMAGSVEANYLKRYERIRSSIRNGRAVIPMEKGSAFGYLLPPQMQVEVRRKNKIIVDEHSGRFVVDRSFFDEAAKILNI